MMIFLKEKHITGKKIASGKFTRNQTNVWRCARSTRANVGFDVVVYYVKELCFLALWPTLAMLKRSKATDYPTK